MVCASACSRKIAEGKADGAAIYSESCARCHGPNGVPDAATVARTGVRPLTSNRVQVELTDADIRTQVLNGSANGLMPAFVGALTDEQVDAVIGYVRSLPLP